MRVEMLDAFRGVLMGDAREKVLYGGSGSGKTHAVQQYAILRGLEEPGEETLIVMETIPGVLTGMYYPMRDMLQQWGIPHQPRESVPIRIELPNGHQLLFTSADKSEKLKHYTNVRRVIINEATGLAESDFNQLMNRMGRTYSGAEILFTFNPIDEHHWLVERYVTPYLESRVPAGAAVHHSTYRDNPFLSPEWCEWLESRMSADPNFYRVYALGLPGHLEGLIYAEGTNWTHAPMADWPEALQDAPPRAIGIDFGFNDPATAIAFWELGGVRYAHELVYESGLIDDDLVGRLDGIFRQASLPRTTPLICDSARPDSIEKLKRRGYRAEGTKKDIAFGIGEVKAKPLVVSDESGELIKELRNYRWAERSGKTVDKPVDAFNHALDALRYAIVAQSEPARNPSRFLKFA
ncbi:MAG TPA: PBSX family phage terminase large subunit [Streptomyces sp.]|nr:PBSX family phage terminase large subunit [Streptomyces sp.]